MTFRKTNRSFSPSTAGFSMIDVLVAIVVLATALLALAALQGALTRNAADARARSQVAAYTEGLIDQMRAAGYGNITAATIAPNCTGSATKQQAEACAAQTVAGVSNLKTTVATTPYYADLTTGVFGTAVVTGATGKYDQVKVTTSWTDAAGQPRQLVIDTIVSPVQVDQNNKTLDNANLLPQIGSTPTVRQFNPGLTAGVIPIAMGTTGNSTAATNPQPEILGKNNNQFIGGVSFNVLTYAAPETIDGNANETRITQNIATRVIRCNCKYGAQLTNTNNVFTQPYRPTYWDASQSKYVAPSKTAATTSISGEDPGSSFVNGVYSPEQDTNCDVCCRDRNDTGASGEVRFNPWNTSDNDHYRWVNGSDTTPTVVLTTNSTDVYVNACRMIIVDGVYRVATDFQNYFFGYVGTDTAAVQKVPAGSSSTNTASSPLPTSTYTTDYQNFVLHYLLKTQGNSVIDTSTTLTTTNYPLNPPSSPASGNDAANQFASDGLASGGKSIPANIDITYVDPGKNNTPACIPTGTQDCRYLHARGLYVDHLEPITLTAINNALKTCSVSIVNCLLPLLPFTTINVTQLIIPSQSPGKQITVSNTALTGGNPDQPLRNVVSAISTGANGATDNAISTMGLSNSGLVGTLTQSAISQIDATTTLSAAQQFTLTSGAVGASSTLDFNIVLSGGSVTTGTTPTVGWRGLSQYYTSDSASLVNLPGCPGNGQSAGTVTYIASGSCNGNGANPSQIPTVSLPVGSTAGLQVTLSKYNKEIQGTGSSGNSSTCKQGSNNATGTTCKVYKVSSVSVGATPVPNWTESPVASASTAYTGINATMTLTIPSGLSSTLAASPDLLNIVLTDDATYSYTPDANGNPGGTGFSCLPNGTKYTYTPYTCHQ